MKVKWNIETGYVNTLPDWEFELDLDSYAEDLISGFSEDEILEYLNGVVEEEFRNTITFTFNEKELLTAIRKRAKELKK